MAVYVHLTITAMDRSGESKLSFEGQDYREVKERIKKFVDYIYRSEELAVFSAKAAVDDGIALEREFKRSSYATALSNIMEFLKYIFEVEEVEEKEKGRQQYTSPSWVEQYDVASLTQREKLFLLLKHNHGGQWVRSQDLKVEYETIYGEEIKLSSISTYLSRFYSSKLVERRGSRAQREYMLLPRVSLL